MDERRLAERIEQVLNEMGIHVARSLNIPYRWTPGELAACLAAEIVCTPLGVPAAKQWKSLTIPVEDGGNVAGPLAANVLGSNAGERTSLRARFQKIVKSWAANERLLSKDMASNADADANQRACDGDCCRVPPAEVSSTGKAPDTVVLTTDQVAEMPKDSAPEPRAETWRDRPKML